MFSLMAAGIDGHAKNYSVLIDQGVVRLAPLYDLISAIPLLDQGVLAHKVKMGMKYGKEYRLRGVGGRNLMRAADDLGYERGRMYDDALAVAGGLPHALAEALTEMLKIPVTDRILGLPEAADRFIQRKLREIESEDLDVA